MQVPRSIQRSPGPEDSFLAGDDGLQVEPVRFDDPEPAAPDEIDAPSLPSRYGKGLRRLRRQNVDNPGPTVPGSSGRILFPSGLDFERVINLYSIQATRDRLVRDVDQEEDPDPAALRRENHNDGQSLLKSGAPDYSTFDEELNDKRRPSNSTTPPPPPLPPPEPFTQRKASHRMKRRHRRVLGYTGRTATRWALTIITGLLTGLTSIMIVSCTDVIQEWRSNFVDIAWNDMDRPTFSIFAMYAVTNLTLAMLSALCCIFLAPEAIGSGIPEVTAYLNGVRVKRFSSLRLFLVKIIGTILSVSSGLVVGPEGPLVHIGAILGASCTKISTVILQIFPDNSLFNIHEGLWSFVTQDLSHFSTDAERRDLVSIGAAAGFAAAFGAPIGGLLFSMEEASSYFNHSMFLKTLVATSIATFCLAVLHGDLSDYSIISLGNFETPDQNIFLNRVAELPLYVLVAVAGGILGGVFCKVWMMVQLFRKQNFTQPRSKMIYRICEVAFVSLLTSSLTYFIPLTTWTCRTVELSDDLVSTDAVDVFRFHAHQFDCPAGEINELADIFFGSREDAISAILTDPTQFNPWTLLTVGAVFFPLLILTLGTAIPSGIFMPTFLIGSSLGGAAGMIFKDWFGGNISPSTFALLGAAALLAGIQHSTVSLCVILVEGTGQVKILIPVIITVVVSRYVAGIIHKHGLYETAMEINHYPYLEHDDKKGFDIFPARDIMSAPPLTLNPRERVSDLVKMLRTNNHHGFPVVDPITEKFLGLVRRDQLVALIECGVFDELDDRRTLSFDEDDSSLGDSSRGGSLSGYDSGDQWASTPMQGIGKSFLSKCRRIVGDALHYSILSSDLTFSSSCSTVNKAYHIKDDRYSHLEKDTRFEKLKMGISNKTLAADAFDSNAWLVAMRQSLAAAPAEHKTPQRKSKSMGSFALGDDSLPIMTTSNSSGFLNGIEATVSTRKKGDLDAPDCFALVGTNRKGTVIIQWLNPLYRNKYINVAGVMNQATVVVTEFCPGKSFETGSSNQFYSSVLLTPKCLSDCCRFAVSKAHFLFTSLGLRHLIVLGGEGGGKVVGIITRINLLKEYIEERTGYLIEYD